MISSFVVSSAISFLVAMVLLTLFNGAFKVRQRRGVPKMIAGYFLMVYLVFVLVEVVGFPSVSHWMRSSYYDVGIFKPIISLVPFEEGLSLSDTLNMMLFIPLGLALPALWSPFHSLIKTVLYGFLFSLSIELGQMFSSARVTDINDLIMNTTGVLFGWLMWRLISYGTQRKQDKKKGEKNFSEQRSAASVQTQAKTPNHSEKTVDWLVYPVIAFVASICS